MTFWHETFDNKLSDLEIKMNKLMDLIHLYIDFKKDLEKKVDLLNSNQRELLSNQPKITTLEKKVNDLCSTFDSVIFNYPLDRIEDLEDTLSKCGTMWDFRLTEQCGFILELSELTKALAIIVKKNEVEILKLKKRGVNLNGI